MGSGDVNLRMLAATLAGAWILMPALGVNGAGITLVALICPVQLPARMPYIHMRTRVKSRDVVFWAVGT